MTHYWDAHDPKLIVCEAKILMDIFHKKEKEEKKIVSLSKTMDDGPVSSSVLWQRMKKFLTHAKYNVLNCKFLLIYKSMMYQV